ncbi:hypothetical protein [Streptomyces drozdowiczii]|uniref:Uncharacterized protein n=1 Tax=Streptomyces drozdowiczii TaxID=202862 RepID=A0ABY6PND6_9ACTN|nr:hypothetical protein [Streptomyces drozdowiczii]MCX0246966.1 hypothetical protein [Streptomyces drozdowiczii]UZK53592.1 hypothetical protein NEH16_05025 [Streptomyces drozdowiczii]
MSHVNNVAGSSEGAWIFGLEEISAADASEDGAMHPPVLGRALIRAPEDTPQALRWAAEEFVDQCGPDWAVSSVLLRWLKIEAGDELLLGVESCVLERVSDDQIRLHANYNQWDDLVVPISVVRRMLVDMAYFIVMEARHPLPAWRIRRLGERDWSRRRNAE